MQSNACNPKYLNLSQPYIIKDLVFYDFEACENLVKNMPQTQFAAFHPEQHFSIRYHETRSQTLTLFRKYGQVDVEIKTVASKAFTSEPHCFLYNAIVSIGCLVPACTPFSFGLI